MVKNVPPQQGGYHHEGAVRVGFNDFEVNVVNIDGFSWLVEYGYRGFYEVVAKAANADARLGGFIKNVVVYLHSEGIGWHQNSFVSAGIYTERNVTLNIEPGNDEAALDVGRLGGVPKSPPQHGLEKHCSLVFAYIPENGLLTRDTLCIHFLEYVP